MPTAPTAKTPFESALEFVLAQEGGYTDDPNDSGGATNLGIEQAEYQQFMRDPNLDVRNITLAEATQIYQINYWETFQICDLPAPLSIAVFDNAVNQGGRTAAEMLQGIIGAVEDGDIGPKTLLRVAMYVKDYGMDEIVSHYTAARVLRYHDIAIGGLSVFLKGWLHRALDCEHYCMEWIARSEE